MIPRVSVVMSAHNGAEYLGDAIESILRQTFADFECIIIDDGSTDATLQILAEYQRQDARVRVWRFEQNRWLSAALNEGIRMARGEYIARMDADDLSLPERLSLQTAFLDAHPEVGVCGSAIETFGEGGGRVAPYKETHDEIAAVMLFACPLPHPAVIFRRELFARHNLWYDESIRFAQDYDLWSRALPFTRFANLPQVTLRRRVHPASAGSAHLEAQRATSQAVYPRLLGMLGIAPSADELSLHAEIGSRRYRHPAHVLTAARRWLEKIRRANLSARLIFPPALDAELGKRWTLLCYNSAASGVGITLSAWQTPLQFEKERGWRKALYLFFFLKKRWKRWLAQPKQAKKGS